MIVDDGLSGMLLCGTHDGLYELVDGAPEQVLDCGRVWDLSADGDVVLAATETGLYRSTADDEWTEEQLDEEPTAVLSKDGGVLVGTRPVGVYRRTPGAAEDAPLWQPAGDLAAHPHGERWRDRAGDPGSTVRTIALHPEDGILAGLEPGGVYAFDGDFWRQYGDGVHDDVHDLLVLKDGAVVAATGNGLYRTEDGTSWVRIDVDFRDFHANYFRESIVHDGRLFASAHRWNDDEWGAVFDGPIGGDDTSDTFGFDVVDVPTEEPAFVIAWVVDGGTLYAGTMRSGDGFEQTAPAELLALEPDGWSSVAELPAGITALASVPANR